MSRLAARPAAARLLAATCAATLAGAAACADAPSAPSAPTATPALDRGGAAGAGGGAEGRGDFHRYVAVGTSVSMGWQSDGVLGASQETSWPAQLARLAHRELSLPRIAFPGCGAPLAAPLASGLRISREPAAAPLAERVCAPNDTGVTLPAGNVAIVGARTDQALLATPEAPDPNYAPVYSRVLAAGQSQITAMEALDPKIVSVELGANEILGVRDGAYVPGQTVVPVGAWAPVYRAVVDRVDRAARRAVLVGLIDDARSFPSFRAGAELWAARATFAPFHVQVSDDCAGSENVLFVPVRVPLAAAQGAARARAGLSPAVLSCANAPAAAPDGSAIRDYVLSPAEVAQANAQLAAMNAVIRAEAERRGFAYFALGALYERANRKAPFSAVTLLTSPQPYGPLISLDGLHPSAAGHAVLAAAAADALNARYRLGIPTSALAPTRSAAVAEY
jgi:hypothetical protein